MKKILASCSLFVGLIISLSPALFGFAPVPLMSPVSSYSKIREGLYPTKTRGWSWHFKALGETGKSCKSRNDIGCSVPLLQVNHERESLLAALVNPVSPDLKRYIATDPILRQVQAEQIQADGQRGTVELSGEYQGKQIMLSAGVTMPAPYAGHITCEATVPFRDLKIYNTSATLNQPAFALREDLLLQRLFSSPSSVTQQAASLRLGDWSDSRVESLLLSVGWSSSMVRESFGRYIWVAPFCDTGALFTLKSNKKPLSDVLALSLEHDGAVGIPFRAGAVVESERWFKAGLSGDMLYLISQTDTHKIKTFPAQTDFFLFNRGRAKKEYGLFWGVNAFMQIPNICAGIGLGLGYQYEGKTGDLLIPKRNSCASDPQFAASEHLQQKQLTTWKQHTVIAELTWRSDFCSGIPGNVHEIAFFYKKPVAGNRYIDAESYGLRVACNF